MQSEEKVKALRHDMKNHLGELALMAANQNNEEIRKYIQDIHLSFVCSAASIAFSVRFPKITFRSNADIHKSDFYGKGNIILIN